MSDYLSTEDAARYLCLKERKLYELAATGSIPCSKVTGKWLFPRAALDRWVESGLARPAGYESTLPPPIIGGSHDPLLEWAVRRSGSGFALLPEGSGRGLDRLVDNQVSLAAIHLHGGDGDDASRNIDVVGAAPGLFDAVLIAFARREQGLVVAAGNPLGLTSLAGAVSANARFGLRQGGAGAQLLLDMLLARSGIVANGVGVSGGPFATGQDLAFSVRSGDIDCGVATRAVANANGLSFVPLCWERFDLALRRRSYFEAGAQALFGLMRTSEFHRHAERLGGYDTADTGSVRLNR